MPTETMAMTETRWVDPPDAPALAALRFRCYADESDIAGMAEVIRAANEANGRMVAS